MTNEIKEILDNFKIYEDRYKKYNETQFIIFYRDIHLLLDYITNLQESHCDYKEKCNEYNVGCIKEILCNYQKTNNNLQQRIGKAIEYIEKYWQKSYLLGTWEFFGSGDELLDILRGDE